MRRSGTITVVLTGILLLAGCMLLPGKFASDLALHNDGTFSFTYKGDIHLVALSKMAADERNKKDGDAAFEPANKASASEKKKSEEAMMKTMLGGIDPSDPRAAQEFADRLRRQNGWKSVIDKGDGRFEVEFAIAGRLDHDFTFPTIEKFPMITPFVTLVRRTDGTVRVEAPAFSPSASSSPMMGMAAAAADGKNGAEGMPVLDGVLTLVTDGEILANNTDEGPVVKNATKTLVWKVNARTSAAPTALVRTRF